MTASVTRLDVARLTAPDVKRSDEMQTLFDFLTEQDQAMGMPDLNALPVTQMRQWRAKAAAALSACMRRALKARRRFCAS